MPHPSVDHTIDSLRRIAPSGTFLALGQTVFWDEPVKAVWRRILDREWPSAQLVAGIHDTDYFAKTTAHVPDDQDFLALAHDDGATRGLWSAAGELSTLLGSEDLPTRSFYESLGVPFDKLAGRDSSLRRAFFAEYTSAYGWRGIVQTIGQNQISHDVKLEKFVPVLLSLLDWGFDQSISCLDELSQANAREVAEKIRGWVTGFFESCSDECTLSDLYRSLLPKLYELLLDFEPSNFLVTSTTSLLRFTPETASLKRFAFVNHFLNPDTRLIATSAYNRAVTGGGMYALDHFGADALPFDIVVPGKGRGTLHVASHQITVDFQPLPLAIGLSEPVTDVSKLATVLQQQFGENVVLVGKAVSLISMLSAEFIVVFHESASGYTDRTLAMNNEIRAAGVEVVLNPIVRLQYQTWDSLASVHGPKFMLPSHLASTFETAGNPLPVSEFAKKWRQTVASQQAELTNLSTLRSQRHLLSYLIKAKDSTLWASRLAEFEESIHTIASNYAATAKYQSAFKEIRNVIQQLKTARQSLETLSGDHFRNRVRPLREAAATGDQDAQAELLVAEHERRVVFIEALHELSIKKRFLKARLKAAMADKRAAERTPEVQSASEKIASIVKEANLAKLSIARDGYLTVHGLPHTNSRPTAWWLPMVDSTGAWFDNITDSVEASLEYV